MGIGKTHTSAHPNGTRMMMMMLVVLVVVVVMVVVVVEWCHVVPCRYHTGVLL